MPGPITEQVSVPGAQEYFDGNGTPGQVLTLALKPLFLYYVAVRRTVDGKEQWVELLEGSDYALDKPAQTVTITGATPNGPQTVRVHYFYDPSGETTLADVTIVGDDVGLSKEVTQLSVLAKLEEIFGAVDELEIKADSIDLNTDELEAKLQAILVELEEKTEPADEQTIHAPHVVSASNSSIVVPTTGSPFIGVAEDVLNFASLTINLATVGSPHTGTLFFEFSPNGTDWDVSVPLEHTSSRFFVPVPLRVVLRYFRVRYVPNDNNLSAFRLTTLRHRFATEDLTRFVTQNFRLDTEPVKVVGSIGLGSQPDGDTVTEKADGVAFTTTTPLGAAGTFTSPWVDTDGWATVEVFIATDQVSGTGGIEVEFTDDAGAGIPTVRGTRKFTFDAEDVAVGFLVVYLPAALDGFRVRYTNGGTPQGSFFLAATLHVQSQQPIDTLVSQVLPTSASVMTRAVPVAQNDLGVFGPIGRGAAGGLRVSVREHEADTPIKSLLNYAGSAGTADPGPPATKVLDITAVPAGARSVQIQAAGANNQILFFGDAAVSQTGAWFELDKGQAITIEVGSGLLTDLFAISGSGTQRYRLFWVMA